MSWKKRIGAQNGLSQASINLMQAANPMYIPRNHLVEAALEEAQERGSLASFHALLSTLTTPYQYENRKAKFQSLPIEDDRFYKTYCGT
jgi:serine/tyrosine/threonine adenylyltransferase